MNIPPITIGSETYSGFNYLTKGFMGEIYKGEDLCGNPVVLKVSPIENETCEQQLKREAQVSLALKHNNVVNTRAAGNISLGEKPHFFMIQDFCEKGNLKELIKAGTSLAICKAWMFEILDGVQAVHTKVIHRDLKPENILVSGDGHLKISDFGIAKPINEDPEVNHFKGWGTCEYMSPECWTFGRNTPAMDIYSLGIIFFEILTGELPCKSTKAKDLKEFHLTKNLPSIASYRSDCPTKVENVLRKMTSKDIAQRYQSTDEVIFSLQESFL